MFKDNIGQVEIIRQVLASFISKYFEIEKKYITYKNPDVAIKKIDQKNIEDIIFPVISIALVSSSPIEGIQNKALENRLFKENDNRSKVKIISHQHVQFSFTVTIISNNISDIDRFCNKWMVLSKFNQNSHLYYKFNEEDIFMDLQFSPEISQIELDFETDKVNISSDVIVKTMLIIDTDKEVNLIRKIVENFKNENEVVVENSIFENENLFK